MLAMRTSALALAPLRPAHCVPSRARASTSVSVSVAKTPSRGARVTRGRTRLTRMRTTRVGAAGNDPPGPLDSLVAGVDAKKLRAAVASDSDADLVQVETVPPMQFLLSSTAFYVVMGVGSQVASGFLNIHPDVLDATRSLNLDQASLWMVPLLLSLAFAITHADKYEFLAEVRDIFKVGVLPSLAPLGLPVVVGDAHERVGARAASSRPLCALPRACVHVGVGVRGENPVSRRACYAWQNTINTNAHDARRCCWERPARPAG